MCTQQELDGARFNRNAVTFKMVRCVPVIRVSDLSTSVFYTLVMHMNDPLNCTACLGDVLLFYKLNVVK